MSGQFISLEKTCDFLSGYAWSAANFEADPVGLPIIRIQNVDAVRDSEFVYWPGEYEERFVVRAGDLLLTLSGSFRAVVWQGPDALLNQRIVKLTPKPGYSLDWLLHVLRNGLNTISGLGRHALVSNVALADLRQLKVPFHTSEEQRRIAAILDQAETLRTQRRQALAHLDTLTQSLFLDMFGDPMVNERGWASYRVDEICELVRGSSPRPQGDPRYFGGPIPRLMVADITRDGWLVTPNIDSLTVEGASLSRPIVAGTVVMAVSGNVGLVSRLAIDACVHDGFVAFKKLDETRLLPSFFLLLLHFSKQVHERNKAGAIFQNLTTTDIKAMHIIAPPLALQQTFATRIQAIEALKATHRTALAQLNALFASLQQRAFAGEL